MAAEKLTDGALQSALAGLDGWALDDAGNGIEKTFGFDDFNAAFGSSLPTASSNSSLFVSRISCSRSSIVPRQQNR